MTGALLPYTRQRHTHAMGPERGGQSSPDLFSADKARDASGASPKPPAVEAETGSVSRRYVLPNNLHEAVKYLNDEELDSLRAATLEEMKRRGRGPLSVAAKSAQSTIAERLAPTDKISRRRRVEVTEVPLTRGQMNAVRSAFKAGISPARIARQFGISQSNVRRALARDNSSR